MATSAVPLVISAPWRDPTAHRRTSRRAPSGLHVPIFAPSSRRGYREFLEIAADTTDGFYGILAQHVLGRPVPFDWHQTLMATDHMGALMRIDGAKRAMALGQLGRREAADAEIRKLAARANPNLTEALAALAEKLQLPATQMRVAQRARLQDGRRHDGALYPVPPWSPDGGMSIDRALLFSVMRAESGFDPDAKSHAGALGVMQILPSTAEAMAERYELDYAGAASLRDPEINLQLGQAYLQRLRDTYFIGDSIIHMADRLQCGPEAGRGVGRALSGHRRSVALVGERADPRDAPLRQEVPRQPLGLSGEARPAGPLARGACRRWLAAIRGAREQ